MRIPMWLLLVVVWLPIGPAGAAGGLYGQVVSVERGDGRLRIRPHSGNRMVEVRIAPRAIPKALQPGSRVRISGQFRDGRRISFQGQEITLLSPRANSSDPTGVRSRLQRRP